MGQAKFNLRFSSTSGKQNSDPNTTVVLLGLSWNTATDMLSLSVRKLPDVNTFIIKWDIWQSSPQIYDPGDPSENES